MDLDLNLDIKRLLIRCVKLLKQLIEILQSINRQVMFITSVRIEQKQSDIYWLLTSRQ